MEYSAYMARMMGNADRKAQLAFAKKEGKIEDAIAMLREGLEPTFVARITKLPQEEILALR